MLAAAEFGFLIPLLVGAVFWALRDLLRRRGVGPDVVRTLAPVQSARSDRHSDYNRKEVLMNNAKAIFDVLQSYFHDRKYQFSVASDRELIEALMYGRNGIFNARIGVCEDPTFVSISILLPVIVPETRRIQAAETASRANHGLLVGCFDVNMSNGIIVFRASVPVADAVITVEQFDVTWKTALATTDRFHRAFCRLLYGDDLSPAEVVAEVEMAEK